MQSRYNRKPDICLIRGEHREGDCSELVRHLGGPRTKRARQAGDRLVVQGSEDTLVDFRGNDEILAAARTADKVKLVAENGAHGSSAVETIVDELLQWSRGHR